MRHRQPHARDRAGKLDDRHRQPGLSAVLRRERRQARDRAVGDRRPDQRRGLRERRRLRDRGRARVRQGRRGLDRRAVRQLVRAGPQDVRHRPQPGHFKPERAQTVDLSKGYYFGNQALVVLKGSPLAKATSVAELKDVKSTARRSGRRATTRSPTSSSRRRRPRRLRHERRRHQGARQQDQIDGSWSTCRPPTTSRTSRSRTRDDRRPVRRAATPEYFSVVLGKDSPLTTASTRRSRR